MPWPTQSCFCVLYCKKMNLEFETDPAATRPQRQIRPVNVPTGGRITGGKRRPAWEIKKPTVTTRQPGEDARIKKMKIAEEEVVSDSASLLTGSVARYGCQDEHAKRFKAACQKSDALELLLKDHLSFVSSLPSTAQLGLVIANKWLQTKFD